MYRIYSSPVPQSLLIAALLLMGLGYAQVALETHTTPLEPAHCSGDFAAHRLEHVTRAHGPEVSFYDSNGAGVAAGDLDGDGDLDLVLANLDGANAIFWNEGALEFRKQALGHGDSRGVAIVDVDGDTRPDIVFTQSAGALSYWRNLGEGFRRATLPGVTRKAYTMVWDDLDADGDLDLVTASYDALLEQRLRDSFLFSSGAGVAVYMQEAGGFAETRLADSAQALALTLYDADGDGRRDIVVGNDFELPDYVFLQGDAGWLEASPFPTTTRNTMSFDAGDIDNDGRFELFATDMKPDFGDLAALAAWTPLMDRSYRRKLSRATQREENALYKRGADGFDNLAYALKLDATGWSWSGRFGDLDNDGRLDLYVVNGMIAKDVFAHLPGDELVEPNRAFRQRARGFEEVPSWGLGATESGRGMTMADLDNDGDLDIVVNNLETPSVLFENRLCGGEGLEVELTWPGSRNTAGLGALLTLRTDRGEIIREVKSGGGYLSGDPARVHFGLPRGAALLGLEVLWPDGVRSVISEVAPQTLLTLTRQDSLSEASP